MPSLPRLAAGAATVDITPALGPPVYLAGFAPNRTARGVLHPLTATALYLAQGETSVCLVSLDLIGLLHPDVERIRDHVTHLLPREHVLVCCTHTHAGPDTLGLWGPAVAGVPYRSGINEEYQALVIERAAQAVEAAVAAAAPANLVAATFDIPAGWVRNDRQSGGGYARAEALGVVRDGTWDALLLNAAAHPETLWEKNRDVSPDYPAAFRRGLQTRGVTTPLFFSGPLGAMLTPAVAPRATLPERRRFSEQFGRLLGDLALETLETQGREVAGRLRVAARTLRIANANPRFDFARKMGFIQRPIRNGILETAMTAVRLGPLSLVTVPGEPAPEVGHALWDVLRGEHRLILALGLDELGYILPPPAFDDKEYAYEQTMSVGPHMAPLMVDTTRALMQELEP